MVKLNHFLVLLIWFAFVVYAQDESGFLSIDCGLSDNSSYIDSKTSIYYVSDAQYIQTDNGASNKISTLYQTIDLDQQFLTVRSFPQSTKNCYTLTFPRHTGGSRYFVRARFMYGNYDGKSSFPTFDLYFGANFWATIEIRDAAASTDKEILYLPNNSSDFTYVCLVNTNTGTPFISALEVRLMGNAIYKVDDQSETLQLYNRFDLRSYEKTNVIRYKEDIFDRLWKPSFNRDGLMEVSTTSIITDEEGSFMIPSSVMTTAITPANASDPIEFDWLPQDPTAGYYLYMHFADFQENFTRQFNINLNGKPWYSNLIPDYLSWTTIMSVTAQKPALWINISLIRTANSSLPPIFNAFEIYTVIMFSDQLTNQDDVNAILKIKEEYGLKRDWQGDPCLPANSTWESIGCNSISTIDDPRIISLNLSFSELTGTIPPSIVNLNKLQSLDLSNNTLTGEVPQYLSEMLKLSVLNLSGNNLTGTVPSQLVKKINSGSLKLSIEGNRYLCLSDPCIAIPNPSVATKKKSSMLPVIGAIVGGLVVLVIIIVLVWVCFIKKKNPQPKPVSFIATDVTSGTNMDRDGPISTQRQNYTYAEVIQMTRNFQKELGKGGFGSVYHGSINNTQVAVKMLSPSSAQGYKQFKAEAELLMRVHHRNLTTLVGYCDEGDKLGLIYEFMANGDLETHLSDKNLKCISWELRLEIAVDAAQGLEYLHHGCKPPIIHRDIKTTNILLNKEMQAKLADFGLSKAFPVDGGTHLSTAFAGTPGYFDPEFNMNETSDVYSFGVVLLEILTGKPPIAKVKERTHLSRWVGQTLETNGDVREVVDRRLGNEFDSNSAWKLVDVAMECASLASFQRPTMNHVVIELKRCLAMEKARLEKETQYETNYESTEYSNVNVEMTGMSPMAR